MEVILGLLFVAMWPLLAYLQSREVDPPEKSTCARCGKRTIDVTCETRERSYRERASARRDEGALLEGHDTLLCMPCSAVAELSARRDAEIDARIAANKPTRPPRGSKPRAV